MSRPLVLPFLLLGAAALVGFTLEGTAKTGGVSPDVDDKPIVTGAGGVQLIADLEQKKLVKDKDGDAWLRIAVQADPVEAKGSRMPVDLTLVIDRSGSMSGAKMKEANRAALEAIGALRRGDRVTVISFDDGAAVHSNNLRVGIDDPSGLRAAINALHGRGGTDMVAGLRQVVATLDGSGATQRTRRVMLLSDGRPNTEGGLVELTHQLRAAGAVMSTLGLGRDYNEDLMARLADAGLGSYYFVDEGQDLAAVFAKELDAAAAVVGREAVAEVQLKHGTRLNKVLGFEHQQGSAFVTIPLGDLYAGRTIDVLSELRHPALAGESVDLAAVRLRFTDPEGNRRLITRPIKVALVEDESVARASAVAHVVEKTVKAQTAQAYLEANEAFNDGDASRGEQILAEQVQLLQKQSASLGSAALADEAQKLQSYQQENRTKSRKAMNNQAKWKARVMSRGY
jgi:Ca-activated chloride channel family protein